MSLSENDKEKIRELMVKLAHIANEVIGPPFDPKIEVMLEMAHALLEEQLELEKEYFEWSSPPPRDDKFMGKDDDIPTPDDLKNMWGE